MKPKPWWDEVKLRYAHHSFDKKYGEDCDFGTPVDAAGFEFGEILSKDDHLSYSIPLISHVDNFVVGEYIFFSMPNPRNLIQGNELNGWIAKVIDVPLRNLVRAVPHLDGQQEFMFAKSDYICRVIDGRFYEMAGWEKPGENIKIKIADDVVVGGGFKEVKPARDLNATYCPNGHIITKFYRGGEFCPTCNLIQTADDRGKPAGWIEPF